MPTEPCIPATFHARGRLPEYMVPSAFVVLDKMPLTASGKIDRRKLPAPDQSRPELDQTYAPPQTPTEIILVNICAEVLGVERVGIHDNFFDVGGHSLLATQVISRIRDAFHVEIPLRQIFERPVMAALAEAIVQAQTEQANEAEIAQILAELGDISEEDAQAILITEADEMTNYDAS